jgi:uncharacterized membrane protein YfcA
MLATFLGLFIGAALGLTGAGGGVLAVPLLMAFIGIPLPIAVPVALAAVALAAALGAALAWRAGHVRYRAAGLMALCGVVASPLGLWLANRLPSAPLTLLFAALMLWMSRLMWRGPASGAEAKPDRPPCLLDQTSGRLRWTLPCTRAMVGLGSAAGLLSGLLGVGGGFVMVPGLQRNTDIPMESAVGTSLTVVALVSTWGMAASAAMSRLDTAIAGPFALGAVMGMVMARAVCGYIPAVLLRRSFAVLAVVVALWMAGRALAG